jgi:hypothetical protein
MIHIFWGIYLTMFWYRVPHPFGAFEPFYPVLSEFWLGVLFLFVALFALAKNLVKHPQKWWIRPAMTAPQQVVLMWGMFGGMVQVWNEHMVDRAILALCYVLAITIFHTVDVYKYWHAHLILREVDP